MANPISSIVIETNCICTEYDVSPNAPIRYVQKINIQIIDIKSSVLNEL